VRHERRAAAFTALARDDARRASDARSDAASQPLFFGCHSSCHADLVSSVCRRWRHYADYAVFAAISLSIFLGCRFAMPPRRSICFVADCHYVCAAIFRCVTL